MDKLRIYFKDGGNSHVVTLSGIGDDVRWEKQNGKQKVYWRDCEVQVDGEISDVTINEFDFKKEKKKITCVERL